MKARFWFLLSMAVVVILLRQWHALADAKPSKSLLTLTCGLFALAIWRSGTPSAVDIQQLEAAA